MASTGHIFECLDKVSRVVWEELGGVALLEVLFHFEVDLSHSQLTLSLSHGCLNM